MKITSLENCQLYGIIDLKCYYLCPIRELERQDKATSKLKRKKEEEDEDSDDSSGAGNVLAFDRE